MTTASIGHYPMTNSLYYINLKVINRLCFIHFFDKTKFLKRCTLNLWPSKGFYKICIPYPHSWVKGHFIYACLQKISDFLPNEILPQWGKTSLNKKIFTIKLKFFVDIHMPSQTYLYEIDFKFPYPAIPFKCFSCPDYFYVVLLPLYFSSFRF